MKKLLWYSCWFVLITSCANIVPPTGGPKDLAPPKIAHESPANFSTRFSGNTVTIEFDEYIRLENPSQEIVISPAIEPAPEFSAKGKKLYIKWKGTLDSATTYTIAFGEALRDANESNVFSGFRYVFSTGDELDSLSFTGNVIAAKDDKPAGKVLVLLYRDLSDSVVIKQRPYYFSKTKDDGSFLLENLKAGTYKIVALRDENYNYLYDLPNEEIAFTDTPLAMHDSTAKVQLYLFKENRKQELAMVSKDDSKSEYIKIALSKPAENADLIALSDTSSVGVPEYNATKDSITFWYSRAWQGDSLILQLNHANTDSFAVRKKPAATDAYKENLSNLSLLTKRETYAPAGALFVSLNRPARSADFSSVVLTLDSPQTNLEYKYIRFADSTKRKIELVFARKPGTAYTVLFPPGAFTDHWGIQNDTAEWNILTKTPEDYGSLKLTVTGTEGKNYILQLLDNNGAVSIEKAFTGNASFQFNDMLPGTYQPLVLFDRNGNGKWDTGNYLQRLQPEETYRHNEQILMRANWEMEVELNIK